jgi:patatin-like phospholipase/acyl hydrolase
MFRLVFAWGHNKGTGNDVPSLFRSYAHHQRRKNVAGTINGHANPNPIEKAGPADSCLIWQAARATSAAPSYFNSIRIGQTEYMDGGFGLNNPANKVFYEVSQVNRVRLKIHLLTNFPD